MKDRVVYDSTMRVTEFFSKTHGGIDLGWNNRYSKDQNFKVYPNSKGIVCYIQKGIPQDLGSKGLRSFGNMVKIKHPNGWFSLYAHLKDVYVREGDSVNENTCLGWMGETGNAYGVHLHYEVRNHTDVRVNPFPYLTEAIYDGEEDHSLSIFYVVKPGDTLSSIARRYNMNWEDLYEKNRDIIGNNPNLIKPGQKLVIKCKTDKKTINEIAKEVIEGKWGNGSERRKRLEEAGYSYEEVQKKVNEMLQS